MNGWLILLIGTTAWVLGPLFFCAFLAGATRKEHE